MKNKLRLKNPSICLVQGNSRKSQFCDSKDAHSPNLQDFFPRQVCSILKAQNSLGTLGCDNFFCWKTWKTSENQVIVYRNSDAMRCYWSVLGGSCPLTGVVNPFQTPVSWLVNGGYQLLSYSNLPR